MIRAALRHTLAPVMLLACGGALAQISGSASVVSDYRLRGVSLSDGKPVAQLALDYDDPRGWYAGAFASGVRLRGAGDTLQLMGYGGYAGRLGAGLSWEAGVSNAVFQRAATYNYAEGFVGLAAEHVSTRLSYAPEYFGKGSSWYGEVNGQRALVDQLSLTMHAGLLRRRAAPWQNAPTATLRADLRLGLSLDVAAWKLELAWQATQKKHPAYLYDEGGNPRSVTVTAGYQF